MPEDRRSCRTPPATGDALSESSREPRSWRPLRRAALFLLGLLTIGAPLLLGGVLPEVFVASALLGGAALWLTLVGRGDKVPMTPVAWVLLGGAVMAALCTVPLPAALVAQLSPRALALSSLPGDPPAARMALSLDVPETVMAVARMAGLLTVLLAAACLSARREQARSLARFIAISGVVVTVVAIAHVALGARTMFGLAPYNFEGRNLTVFVDANHAASLGILSTLACLGLSGGRTDPMERWVWWLGAALCIGMTISTQSLGGLAMLAFALGGFVVLQLRRAMGLTGRAAWLQPLLAGGAVVLVLSVLIVVGVLVTDSVEFVQGKMHDKVGPWHRVLQLIGEEWKTGVGAGAFSASFEAFMPPGHQKTITHPENFVLQWLAEWGVPAAIVALLAFAVTFWRLLRLPAAADDRTGALHDALLVATFAVLLHDLADFGLEFAGVGIPFVVALGILVARLERPRGRRWAAALMGAGAVTAAVVATRSGLPRLVSAQREETKLKLYRQKAEQIRDLYAEVMRLHPADAYVALDAAQALMDHSVDPGTRAEKEASLNLALKFLDRSAELTRNQGPYLKQAWILAAKRDRPAAVESLGQAFRRGRYWEDVTRLGNDIGVTTRELASFPPLLKDIQPEADEKIDLISTATERMLKETRVPSRRRRLAEAVLAQVDGQAIPQTTPVLSAACRALTDGAWCARRFVYGCDLPRDADRISARALRLGADWIRRAPTEPQAYVCAGQAYWSFGATEERARVLSTGVARSSDVALRVALASALLDFGQPATAIDEVSNIIPENQEPPVTESIYMTRARAYWEMGKRAKALRQVDDALRLNPEAFWAYALAARYHEAALQYDQAISLLDSGRRFQRGRDEQVAEWRKSLVARRRKMANDSENIEARVAAMDDPSPTGAATRRGQGQRQGVTRFTDIDVQLRLLHLR